MLNITPHQTCYYYGIINVYVFKLRKLWLCERIQHGLIYKNLSVPYQASAAQQSQRAVTAYLKWKELLRYK